MTTPHPPRTPLRSLASVALIVLISAAVAVIAAELYLASRATSDLTLPFYNRLYPYVMFRPYENHAYVSAEPHLMSRGRKQVFHYTNEDGFRVPALDYPLPREKPDGQLRVAVLGSSAVQLGSTFEDTLPGALKALLRREYPGRDIEVINAGNQSCVSRQSIAQLVFTVADYQPDIVILYDGVNDLGLPLTYEARPNFPYNFHVMEQAWELYRRQRRTPPWRLALDRSHLYGALRARFGAAHEPLTDPVTGQGLGSTAIPARQLLQQDGAVTRHVAAYLANWRKLAELSAAYGYDPVCVLQPTGSLEPGYAVPLLMREFHLSEQTATDWTKALAALYAETEQQIEDLRAGRPDAVFLNLARSLAPAADHFWDLCHVYDETNPILAERLLREIRPQVERRLPR